MAIEAYNFNDVKSSPTEDSNKFDFSKIMAGAPNPLEKLDKPANKSEGTSQADGVLDFSGSKLLLCAEIKDDSKNPQDGKGVKDDKPKDPNEDKLATAGYKAYLSGDFKEAEKQYKSLLELQEKNYRKESKETAFTSSVLGSTCEKDNRYADAKAYYKQSAEITAKVSGKDHLDTGLQHNNVARMEQHLKNWKEAAAAFKSAVEILADEKNGPSSDNGRMTDATAALKNYAEVLKKLGDDKEADKQLKRAAEIEKSYYDGPRGNVIYF